MVREVVYKGPHIYFSIGLPLGNFELSHRDALHQVLVHKGKNLET